VTLRRLRPYNIETGKVSEHWTDHVHTLVCQLGGVFMDFVLYNVVGPDLITVELQFTHTMRRDSNVFNRCMRNLQRHNSVENLAIKFEYACAQTVNSDVDHDWVFPEDLVSLHLQFTDHQGDMDLTNLFVRIFRLGKTLQYLHLDWAMHAEAWGLHQGYNLEPFICDSWSMGLVHHLSKLRRFWTTDHPFKVDSFNSQCHRHLEHRDLNEVTLQYENKKQALELFYMINKPGNNVTHLCLISDGETPDRNMFDLTVGYYWHKDYPYENWPVPRSRTLCSFESTNAAFRQAYPQFMRPAWIERFKTNYAHLVWWRRTCLYAQCVRDGTLKSFLADSVTRHVTDMIEQFIGVVEEEHKRVHPACIVQQTRLDASQCDIIRRCRSLVGMYPVVDLTLEEAPAPAPLPISRHAYRSRTYKRKR
jgi:hypothetical protein